MRESILQFGENQTFSSNYRTGFSLLHWMDFLLQSNLVPKRCEFALHIDLSVEEEEEEEEEERVNVYLINRCSSTSLNTQLASLNSSYQPKC